MIVVYMRGLNKSSQRQKLQNFTLKNYNMKYSNTLFYRSYKYFKPNNRVTTSVKQCV